MKKKKKKEADSGIMIDSLIDWTLETLLNWIELLNK